MIRSRTTYDVTCDRCGHGFRMAADSPEEALRHAPGFGMERLEGLDVCAACRYAPALTLRPEARLS